MRPRPGHLRRALPCRHDDARPRGGCQRRHPRLQRRGHAARPRRRARGPPRRRAARPAAAPSGSREVVLVWDRGPGRSDERIRDLARRARLGATGVALAQLRPARRDARRACPRPAASGSSRWTRTASTTPPTSAPCSTAPTRPAAQLVYASPTNAPPHGSLRNAGSRVRQVDVPAARGRLRPRAFHSYRLILGEVGRSAAAYTGSGVYLDVALAWVVSDSTTCPIPMRSEGRPASNYSLRQAGVALRPTGHLLRHPAARPRVAHRACCSSPSASLYSLWVLANRFLGDYAPAGLDVDLRRRSSSSAA